MFKDHKKIIAEIDRALSKIDGFDLMAFLDLIVKSKKIIVAGAGRMGFAGRGFAMRLSHLGLNAFYFGDTSMPPLVDGDLLVVVSASGETKSICLIAELAKKAGAKVALITCRVTSTLSQLSDATVVMGGVDKSGQSGQNISFQPLTTLNEQSAQILFDTCVLKLMSRLGVSNEMMWARHTNLE